MNYKAIEQGKNLLRNYYTAEAITEMRRDFHSMHLPEEEFPAYVAFCYDMDNAPVDHNCW
jgi:hypothetical protein